MKKSVNLTALTFLTMLTVSRLAAGAPDFTLKVNDARLLRLGEMVQDTPSRDRFGPGLDGVDLYGDAFFHSQAQWSCRAVPEGDYYLGLSVLGYGYVHFAEQLAGQVTLYLNDTRLAYTSHTEPLLPEDAAEKSQYQAELRCDAPVHLRPEDVLRAVWLPQGGQVTVGPLRLYRKAPGAGIVKLNPPEWGRPATYWLAARWEAGTTEGDLVRQPVLFYNPGVLPRTFHLGVEARDYFQRPLLSVQEDVTVGPGQKLTRTLELNRAGADRVRLSLAVTAEGVFPPVRLSRFFLRDHTAGPRPSACLNGEWEWCPVPGAEVGLRPPDDAKWEKISVPSRQPTDRTHCAWYRKVFDAPAHLQGERVVLKLGQVISEGFFYLNGQAVGHELHGSQPFEVDLTSAFKGGQRNELLIGVRDWLAYSPRNRQRVARGEAPIFKDSMVDVAGYPGLAELGIGGNVYLEARPAVSVDDVFVVTSVREHKLTLRYRLRNTSATEQTVGLTPTILDAGAPVEALLRQEKEVKVPAGGTAELTLRAPWADAKLWWPDDPHLYVLQTDLRPATGAADRHLQRFGFRELWIDGISFVLNDTRVKLRSAWAGGAHGASQAWPFTDPARRLEAIWDWQVLSKSDRDVQISRCHNLDSVDEACEIADETGLMIKIEDADMAQQNFTFDQSFWNGALKHEVRVVDTYKNHPAVVIWSAGNENMWGWIYQGDAAKTLGNRWQIKIVQAMREADLQSRPIEWESDGDLMGGWEYHALHYPFELSQHPDVPVSAWWGPLDGKTVVPYSMGNITLGQKPLTDGEAFWPATLSHPYGETVVLGDAGYLGGDQWAKAWIESSQFFTNGFRDVEFAVIDTYTPLWFIPPQTVILKEETRSFVGGERVRREVNVHNDVLRPAALALRWSLTGEGVAARGEVRLQMAPAELRRVKLEIPLPRVTVPTAATLRYELREGDALRHVEERDWRISPPLKVRPLVGWKPAVWDPQGDTAAMLKKLGVPFTALPALEAPKAEALIIGRNALRQPPAGPWREALGAYVRGGGKVLVMEQAEAPDCLPTPLALAAGRRTSIAFCRAADHPALAGLADADLRWWVDDHLVSTNNYRKPLRGNVLPLVDAGTMDGILETPLLEEYDGKGSWLLCQLLVTDKAATCPAAARMMQNLLDYLAAEGCYRVPGATALIAAPDGLLRKALDDSRLVYQDLAGKPEQLRADRFQVAIVEAGLLDDATIAALKAFAGAGGHVMVHRAAVAQQAKLQDLMGTRLRFFPTGQQPNDITYHCFRRANVGLMAGISNHELFWASNRLMPDLRHEGGWWSGYDCPPGEWIADSFVSPAPDAGVPAADSPTAESPAAGAARTLTRPGALVQAPVGKGYVLLSQLRLDECVPEMAVTVTRLRSLLLTNLGCTLRSEGAELMARKQRLQRQEFFTVDLSPYANRGLRDDKAAGIVGWTNQGENDMRALPTGRRDFAGIPFFIASPKAAIVLRSSNANNLDLPTEVRGIKIGRRADELFFLHTAAWPSPKPFKYLVHYEDGTSVEVPVVYGQQVIDWWDDPSRFAEAMARYGLFVAWQGENPMRKGIILPGYEWTNPHPEKVIRDVDFTLVPESGLGAVPVLAAITGAVSRPSQGIVTDVVGTGGLRVRLGAVEQDITYIGVAGLARDDPFYNEAVAAHRAMVLGQKVLVLTDVVTEDAEGHTLAYVYLGDDPSNVRNLVNARIIGEGLGKLGAFGGNERERMYLENLAFIAKQRKAGVWRGQ